MLRKSTTRKTKKSISRPRRARGSLSLMHPVSRDVEIASRDVLPSLSVNQILHVGEYRKSPEDRDVVLVDNYAPQGFTVKAALQQDESFLWIGLTGADPNGRDNRSIVIISGDALRRMVTDFLKHLNAPIFGGAR